MKTAVDKHDNTAEFMPAGLALRLAEVIDDHAEWIFFYL